MSNERQENVGRNVSDLKSNTFNSIEGRRNFMYYFESLAKESADEILQEMVGGKSVQEFRNKFGEESFNQFVALLRNDSELVAKNRMKWAATPAIHGYY